jgi:ATP-dependent Clp protease ATP-binding subunit ClpX
MGFQACPQSKSEDAVSLKDVTTEDLKQYGLIGEFLGRFPVVDALDALSRDEMLAVLKEPKNSLLNQFRKLFYFEGIELNIEDAVLEHIVDRAMKIGTGARALQSEFESVFSELLYDIPDRKIAEPNLVSVRIDEAYLTAKHVRYGYAAEDPRPRQRRAQS